MLLAAIKGSSFSILELPYRSIELAQRLQAPLSCVRQQLRDAPVDSASKKLGRADWCSGAKRAIQAPPRPNALLIQQRHTPGPCHGSV